MAISSIPSSRISDAYVRHRLLAQLQLNQRALLDTEQQISTGRRIVTPSQDVPAAARAIDLQRLLERKEQAQKNLSTNQQYLGATDASLSTVSGLLSQAKSAAQNAIDVGAGPAGRQAAVQQIEQILNQLIDVGNQTFRGRHLFSGSDVSASPFSLDGGLVHYRGNENALQSFSDIDALFDTNLDGHAVFGAISDAVRGTADMNRRLTLDTPLADLRSGQGIHLGGVVVSDGTNSSTVDLRGAHTVGDVLSRLERHPPAGRVLTATISPTGINVSLDALGGGSLTIREVGGGGVAGELGIKKQTGAGLAVAGSDLNPRLTPTTQLADLLGVRASAGLSPFGSYNNLLFEATERGAAFNGVTIELLDGGPGTAGSESAVYDDSNPLDKRLTITIESGVTTANQVLAAVNAEGTFQATLDPHETDNDGSGAVLATAADPAATAITAGGSGQELDLTGLRIVNGGATHDIDLTTAQTVEDLFNLVNRADAGVRAQIDASGHRLDIRSLVSGADFSIGELGGATATQLGVRSLTGETRLGELNFGRGVLDGPGTDFTIRRKDGGLIGIDLAGAQTVGDVLALVNSHPANVVPQVTARLARFGNGLELVSTDPAATATFAVLPSGSAAYDLGLVPSNLTQSPPAVVSGGAEIITGQDPAPRETRGVFAALVRLREALSGQGVAEIERSVGLLDDAATDLNVARAELGARQQSLDVLADRLQDEHVELKSALSRELDVDLVQAVSELAARQAAFEASLSLTGKISQLTLLDFL